MPKKGKVEPVEEAPASIPTETVALLDEVQPFEESADALPKRRKGKGPGRSRRRRNKVRPA